MTILRNPDKSILTREFWFPNLAIRTNESELMDDPNCDDEMLMRTFDKFRYINYLFSGIHSLIRQTIIRDIIRRGATSVSLIDLGAGGCDTGRWFSQWSGKHGISCKIFCIDADQRAVSYGQEACKKDPAITVLKADACDLDKMGLRADYIFSNHFIHHLEDSKIPAIFKIMNTCSRYGFVASDLHRNSLNYFGFTLVGAVWRRKSFIFADGRLSLKRGFTRQELKRHCDNAGVDTRITPNALGHWMITSIAD